MKLHLTELGCKKEKIVSNLGLFHHFLDEEIEAQRLKIMQLVSADGLEAEHLGSILPLLQKPWVLYIL